jgi:hypothetical protein
VKGLGLRGFRVQSLEFAFTTCATPFACACLGFHGDRDQVATPYEERVAPRHGSPCKAGGRERLCVLSVFKLVGQPSPPKRNHTTATFVARSRNTRSDAKRGNALACAPLPPVYANARTLTGSGLESLRNAEQATYNLLRLRPCRGRLPSVFTSSTLLRSVNTTKVRLREAGLPAGFNSKRQGSWGFPYGHHYSRHHRRSRRPLGYGAA